MLYLFDQVFPGRSIAMKMKNEKDIETIEDIQLLVNSFYDAVKKNPLIGPIFTGVIQDRWPEHLEKMYRFWQTVLLDEHTYSGSPFRPHAAMPLQQEHFSTWLEIWYATIDRFFSGARADEAKWRGGKMAVMFLSRIGDIRNSPFAPLV